MRQQIATYILPVEPDQAPDLERLLAVVAAGREPTSLVPFARLPQLHFASLVLFPRDVEGYGPVLVFENNLDGPLERYLDDLLDVAQSGLHQILGHTTGYPGSLPADRATILAHLQAHLRPPSAYHIGNPGRTAERIKQEAELRARLETRLDDLSARPDGPGDASAIRVALRAVVEDDQPTWGWVKRLGPRLTRTDQIVPRIRLYASALIAIGLAIVLLPVTLAAVALLRALELMDAPWTELPRGEHLRDLGEAEDHSAIQNHMASIAIVKGGPFRRLVLRIALWLINLVARTSTSGSLGGIRSIHYAHWSQIDGGRRLLFLSNFDGSWENYLDDFIDRASAGLTLIWSNTKQFPRTRFLVLGGARDGHDFKAVARAYQTRTNVWYSAYPDLTVQQIDRNSTIAEELFSDRETDPEHPWLRNF
jgi:hypothetical protein